MRGEWRGAVWASALVVSGVVFAVVPVVYHPGAVRSTRSVLVSLLPVEALALVVAGTGLALYRRRATARTTRRFVGWATFGVAVASVAVALLGTYQHAHGESLPFLGFVYVNGVIGGAAVGVVVGWYDHRGRTREAELKETSEILETTRRVNQAINESDSREELDRRVCEEFAAATPYTFAWVGDVDETRGLVVPEASAGTSDGYLDAIEVPVDSAGPTARAVRTRTPQIVSDVRETESYREWRTPATKRGFVSSMAIPLVHDGSLYGVVNVYADRADAFHGDEREVLEDLGDAVATGRAALDAREWSESLVETAPDPIVVVEAETGDVLETNRKAADLFGRSRAALESMTLADLRPDAEADRYERLFGRRDHDDPDRTIETADDVCILAADGTEVPVEIRTRAVTFRGRDVIQAHFRDVSQRREREHRLAEFQAAIEHAADGVMLADEDGVVQYVNPEITSMTGYPERSLVGVELERLVSENTDGAETLWDTVTDGEVWRGEIETERADGAPLFIEQTVSPLEAGEHQHHGYVGVSTDVTHRKAIEASLRRSEERFRSLFEEHGEAMLLVRPETGAIADANAAAADFYGYAHDELTSMTVDDVTVADAETPLGAGKDDADADVDADVDADPAVVDHRLASGEIRTVEVHSTPIPTDEGTVLFSIVHDVTERVASERKLERRNEQLEVLNQLLRHDIRNDITVVLGMAELLAEAVPPEAREDLSTLQAKANHVVELTHTARGLTESMSDDESRLGAVPLDRVLGAELANVADSYDEAVIDACELPPVSVRANNMLASVFRNVLNNAVQHNRSARPRIDVEVSVGEERVTVRVADDGPGVPDALKERIFRHGEKGAESGGTGLGLYLVSTLVEQYGGEVNVTDNDPEGTVVHVTLPRVPEDESERRRHGDERERVDGVAGNDGGTR